MNWWRPSKPNEIQPTPWLHPEVIRYLERLLHPDWAVIEHGSGGPTLWLAERVKQVTAFESDPDWLAQVAKHAPRNVAVYPPTATVPQTCDLLLIDGEPVETRAKWIEQSVNIVKPGGWVVLDNCNRREYEVERLALQQYAEFHVYFHCSRGGQKYLNTEFYKLP